MSKHVEFYKVKPITDESFLNAGEVHTDYLMDENISYVDKERAPAWVKKIGKVKPRVYTNIDAFAVAEEIFGTRPVSYSFSSYSANGDYMYLFRMPDDSVNRLPFSEMRKYRKTYVVDSYFYVSEHLVSLEGAWRIEEELLDKFTDRLLLRKDLLKFARRYFEKNADVDVDDSCYTGVMWYIMKCYFLCGEGEFIVLEVE